ncbi:MAG: aminoacyl-tRNA deacylase [Myxococcota bacterium]
MDFERRLVPPREHGGTTHRSRALDVEEHAVVDTRVMQDDAMNPLIVLMHGDRKVSMKRLAAEVGTERVLPLHPSVAERHTGYPIASTSPVGTKRPLPVYAEFTLFELPRIWIDGGSPGFLIGVDPHDLDRLLSPTWVDVGEPR